MAAELLIGTQVSLYTGKVRAYLKYKAIPYFEIPATRQVYRDLIVPRTGARFIPVLLASDGTAVQDSSAIIAFLERRYPRTSVYPDGALQRLVALLFELYADEWLLLPAMHYRWNLPENRAFAIEELGKLSAPQASLEEQHAIGRKRANPFAAALPALGIVPETVPAIEASYLGLLNELSEHFRLLPYLLGSRPSIGDFALFGPLYAHLYRDPASGRLMRQVAPRVAHWVERMLAPKPLTGDFLPADAIPETLMPPLTRMFREFGPVLASTIERVISDQPTLSGLPLPRAIGRHTFELSGVRSKRAVYPFNLWRWQAAHDHYLTLALTTRMRADQLLGSAGGLQLMYTPLERRLGRRGSQLFLALANGMSR